MVTPAFLTNSLAWLFHTRDDSIAIGANRVCRIYWYFCVLETVDLFAACPAVVAVAGGCDCAYVSGIVTSHFRHFPCFYGIKVTPSGRVLSLHSRPGFFRRRWCLGSLHGSPHDVVHPVVPCYPCRTVATRQTTSASTFYLLPTWTDVWLADVDAEPHSLCDPDSLVCHSKSHCCGGWR